MSTINASDFTFTADGKSVNGYLARPADQAQAPAIIIIHEWWGLNDHIRDIARRYAQAGFVAAAVDLYEGATTKDAQEAGRMMGALDPKKALAGIETALKHLRGAEYVSAIGITGFCMGGVYTLLAACNFQFEAAVPFYGMPDDLSVIQNLRCPVLFIGGERDQWITVEKMNRLDAAFKQYGKDAEVKIYAGADHAFFNDTRPDVYSAKDAADAWNRAIEFFSKHLKKGQTASA
ncbi:MAG TPA: dienelactone hydrolase family protein [Blastocatellia bacterium]|nr:dienelactone hydrolase family protein [Blastocatellia bacterium]